MRAFLAVVGTIFGLIVIAHIARIFAEPRMASEPWFWAITVIAAALGAWSWYLFWKSPGSKGMT